LGYNSKSQFLKKNGDNNYSSGSKVLDSVQFCAPFIINELVVAMNKSNIFVLFTGFNKRNFFEKTLFISKLFIIFVCSLKMNMSFQ